MSAFDLSNALLVEINRLNTILLWVGEIATKLDGVERETLVLGFGSQNTAPINVINVKALADRDLELFRAKIWEMHEELARWRSEIM